MKKNIVNLTVMAFILAACGGVRAPLPSEQPSGNLGHYAEIYIAKGGDYLFKIDDKKVDFKGRHDAYIYLKPGVHKLTYYFHVPTPLLLLRRTIRHKSVSIAPGRYYWYRNGRRLRLQKK